MKILHVIPSVQKAAGPSVFCLEVCDMLKGMGHEVTVAVIDPDRQDTYPSRNAVPLVSFSSVWSGNSYSHPYDVAHIHGMWLLPLHRMTRWVISQGIPIIWSPHGMLSPWALRYKRWKKSIPWLLYQKHDLKKVSCFHVTTPTEAGHVRRCGLSQPVAIAPLGVEMPPDISQLQKNGKIVLFLSRVHPSKGIANLFQAWAKMKDSPLMKGWRIVVAGPDALGHQSELLGLAKTLGLQAGDCSSCADSERQQAVRDSAQDVIFTGTVYGELKDALHRMADLFVLPTYSDNFGVVVPDALSYGLPVITTKGAPWEELETERCGKWIDIGVDPLAEALKEMMGISDEERQLMGKRGRDLVGRKFTWDSIGIKMSHAYETLLAGKKTEER